MRPAPVDRLAPGSRVPAVNPQRPDVGAVLDRLRDAPFARDRLVREIRLPGAPARWAPWPPNLHPRLIDALRARGIDRPYSHQAEAIEVALRGEDVVVVTPTASGKSLCFLLPVLDAWLRDPEARSLWLFPTKALAQDQLAALQDLAIHLPPGLRAGAYDGDTPPGARRAIKEAGHVVVTNPEMLHTGVLPHHTSWVRLFQHLRYVVVDELHAYRGLFGSHVANVLRRLFRLCAFYGSRPTVICCSATIGNPGELAGRLLERPVRCVDGNGAPRAPRRIWLWNPPLLDPTNRLRRSAVLEARRLVAELVGAGLQTIAFCRSRTAVEVLLSYLRRVAPEALGATSSTVRGYRSGYLPLERRAIEAGLRRGEIRAVVSTNALELGVDIGSLDAAVLVGWPGTVASAWQQLGRAGRRDSEALGVIIATSEPRDQFLVSHPEYLLETPVEQGLVDPDNLLVLAAHLQAATFELAFSEGETLGSAEVEPLLECLAADGLVHRSGNRWLWAADAFPADAISLRTASANNVVVVDTTTLPRGPGQGPQGPWSGTSGGRPGSAGRVIGEVDQFSAPVLVHDDAIYLHEGVQYHVERLDWEEKRAYVHPVAVDYYTVAETRVAVSVLERHHGRVGRHYRRDLGEVRISRLATLYKKVRFLSHETVGSGPIVLPEQDLHTLAVWWALSPERVGSLPAADLDVGLCGLARAVQSAACLLCMCDPHDLGVHAQRRGVPGPDEGRPLAEAFEPLAIEEPIEHLPGWRPSPGPRLDDAPSSVGWPTLFLYDSVPGGVGFAARCFEEHDRLVSLAEAVVTGCTCRSGCPSCVGVPPEGSGADARGLTLRLLSAMRS